MKKDKKLIPIGCYCYTLLPIKPGELMPGLKPCPYWKRISKYNAYCGYLGKDDNELSATNVMTIVYPKKDKGKKFVSTPAGGGSLLWDKCKACRVK